MRAEPLTLDALGWGEDFEAALERGQRSEDCARVTSVRRKGYEAIGVDGPVFLRRGESASEADRPTVGDWVVVEPERQRYGRVLPRRTVFQRVMPGRRLAMQLIAANVDTAFVVTSCNQDFNPARLERFLAVVREAGAEPVVVLTKADLAEDPDAYVEAAEAIAAGAAIAALNAKDWSDVVVLEAWAGPGRTIALIGASGVGKTTLMNALTGEEKPTASVRERDDRGRHTTRARSMHRLMAGGWIIDTPGIRELGLADVAAGLDETFPDILALAQQCRFSDCRHQGEPGCAVQAAVEAGALDPDRLVRFQILAEEAEFNDQRLARRRIRSGRAGGAAAPELDEDWGEG